MVIHKLTDGRLKRLLNRYQCEEIMYRIDCYWEDDEREHDSELDKVIDEAKGVIEDFEDKEHILGCDNSEEARREYMRTKALFHILKGYKFLKSLENN